MKDDYITDSHYLTYTFIFERLGECTFWTQDLDPQPNGWFNYNDFSLNFLSSLF